MNESNFVELERGICEYFAWLSEDIYVMKTPSLSQHKVLSNNKSKSNLPNKPVITESHLIYKKIYAVSNDSIVKLNINYSNSADIKPTTHHKAGMTLNSTLSSYLRPVYCYNVLQVQATLKSQIPTLLR